MVTEESFWYRVGYALERGRRPSAPREWRRLAGLAERASRAHPANEHFGEPHPAGTRRPPTRSDGGSDERGAFAVEQLVSVGIAALVGRLLDVWRPRKRARFTRLVWAGAAGAVAALLVDALRPLLRGEPGPIFDRDTADRMLVGLGQGLLYGAVIEPRVPGPSVLKGALFGSAEYAAAAAGGLVGILGAHAPQRKLPFLGRMLDEIDPHDRVYLEHLAFGVALAILYGSNEPSKGIVSDEDEDDDE